jgi:hypothetical protein
MKNADPSRIDAPAAGSQSGTKSLQVAPRHDVGGLQEKN